MLSFMETYGNFPVSFRWKLLTFTPGSSDYIYKAEFDGTDGLDGLDGWDGWDGLDGPEKCPLNFFILCGYIDYVYVYLYTKLKLSPTILWV